MRRIDIAAPDFEYDGEDPEGFRAGMARLGKALGAGAPRERGRLLREA